MRRWRLGRLLELDIVAGWLIMDFIRFGRKNPRHGRKPAFSMPISIKAACMPGKHARDFAFVDIPRNAHFFFSFDQKFGEETVFHDARCGFPGASN